MSAQRVKCAWILTGAIVGFSGFVLAESGAPARRITVPGKASRPVMAPELGANPTEDGPPRVASAVLADPPDNDTCPGAIPLELNRLTVGTTADANDDYRSPDDLTCYSGIGNQSTTAPGRDVVYSFTAPVDALYTFAFYTFNPNDVIGTVTNNPVLYLTDDCSTPGTLSCVRGSNRVNPPRGFTTGASNGFGQGNGEAIDCVPMTSGQTHFLIFDDVSPGRCTPPDTNRLCYRDADCAPGSTCGPQINNGGRFAVEVRPCTQESEPNDTPATANPYYCGVTGETHVRPQYHCYLGTRDGQVCNRSPFLPQDHPDSRMHCSQSGGRCVVDIGLGTHNCPIPGEFCQQTTDLDCDPRCDVGPNAGKTCSTASIANPHAFCNPVSDQGATCLGTCQPESTCVVDATGVDTGVACTPVCVGSSIPAVNGRYCSGLSQCPGAGVCTQTPNPPTAGATCLAGQTCTRSYNEGDTDFFSLGVVPADSAVFAAINGQLSNDTDLRMRVTTDTQTLQFDDDDGLSRMGQSSPVIGGALGNGQPTYLEVSKTQFRESAAYELIANVRPPLAQAQLEDESAATGNDNYYLWPGDILSINPINNVPNNGYVRGTFAYNLDSDCFKFLVNEGDVMDWITAANPQRTPGPLTLIDHPQPLIYDAIPAGISNFVWGANPRKNTNPGVPQGGLRATSPAVTSAHLQWRAQYSGMLEVCTLSTSAFVGQGTPTFPNDWSASFTVNCGPVQSAGPGTTTADVSVIKTLPAGPVETGDIVTYTITVENHGTEIAQEVTLDETLDANLTFIGLTVNDGFAGNNIACFSLPTVGTNDAAINCINASMAPATVTTYILTAQVNNCIGAGIQIDNYVTIATVSTDPNPNNDFSLVSFTTSAPPNDGCQDLVCASGVCFLDLCTDGDTCVAGACVPGGPTSCDDNDICTDDMCDSEIGCVNDSSNNGDLCNDFIECTTDSCDPLAGCQFSPLPPATACDDGDSCTNTDQCDGAGTCSGTSICDDGDPCSDDIAAPGTCACSYTDAPSGVACSDSDACTGTIAGPDACDGAGACLGGQPVACEDGDPCNGAEVCDPVTGCGPGAPLICDDGSVCTTDTCDTATGCVFTPITCDDNDTCTDSACDPSSGCFYTPIGCDDSDVCTVDTCDSATGCVHTGIVCNDNDACTADACDPVGGCFGTPITCDDGNSCTTDTCDPTLGCVFTPVVCDDANACNGVETCDPATGCVGGTALVCDDGDACTVGDTCIPASGCVPGPAVVCSALDDCHSVGTCDTTTGACSTPVRPTGTHCEDGDLCTTSDTCDNAGACVGGPAPNCPGDGAICTADVCDSTSGCEHSDINLDTTTFSGTRIDGLDLAVLAAAWNRCPADGSSYNVNANLDRIATVPGACIGATDFHLFMNAFGRSCQ